MLKTVLLCAAAATLPSMAVAKVGAVTQMQGTATVQRGNAQAPLRLGSAIEMGDQLQLNQHSNLIITFEDGSALTLGANTHITIDTFIYRRKANTGEILFDVSKGFFRFISGTMQSDKRHIKTPLSTIGIRGTDVFGEVKGSSNRHNTSVAVGMMSCCVQVTSAQGSAMLTKENTFSKVTQQALKPTKPETCKEAWVRKSGEAMGIASGNRFYRFINTP